MMKHLTTMLPRPLLDLTITRMVERNETRKRLSHLMIERKPVAERCPMISVIMPAYRVAEYIGMAIESVLAQTFTNYEIIVVNDGSPDTADLEAALAPFRERIVYLEQPNAGPSAARNAAIRQARGEYLAFLDADDYWEPQFLARQMACFEENPQLDLVYSDGLLVGDSTLAGRTFMELTPSVGEVSFESLLGGNCTVILSGTVARKRAVVEAGLFDEGLRYSEDFDLWLRVAQNGSRLAFQPEVLLCKRIHGESLSSNCIGLHQSALGVLSRYKQQAALTEQTLQAIAEQEAKLTAIIKLELGKQRLSQGDFDGARTAFDEAQHLSNSWKLRVALYCLKRSPRLLLRVFTMLNAIDGHKRHAEQSHERGGSLTMRAALYMFAKTVAFMFSFMLPLLLVRRLSQHEFGLYKQVFLVVGTALSILPLGVGMSAYYFLPRERERQGQVVLNILLFYLFMAGGICLLFALRPQIVAVIFNSTDLIRYAPLIGIVILLWVFSSFLEIAAVAHQELRLATFFVVSSQFTKTAFLLAATLMFETVWGLIYAALLQGALQTFIMLVYLKSRFGVFWRSFKWAMLKRQLAYALPLGVAAVIIGVQTDIDNYFVANRFGAAAYAIYAIGCFQLPLIGIISDSIGSVLIPRVSYLQKFNRRHEIIEVTARVMRELSAIYFPIYAFLLIMGRDFLSLLFTEQYLASYPIFAINITLIPLAIITSACDPVMRAYAEHRFFLLKARVLLLTLMIGALWVVTSHYGMVGTIATAIGVNLLERAVTLAKVGRVLNVRRQDLRLLKDIGKLTLATAAASLIAMLARASMQGAGNFLRLLVCGVVLSAVYLLGLHLLRVPTEAERQAARAKLSRLRNLFRPRPAALAAPATPGESK
jgi:glycosyltransferase involved in cell wall biosynthesis/O-antigen/teichoic acid export membrane protein